MASQLQGKRVLTADCEVVMGPSVSEATRVEGADLVADYRDLTARSAAGNLIHESGKIDVPIAHLAWRQSPCIRLRAYIAFRFRRWREDRQTWAALRHLDDRQLNEFGIYQRPPDLTKRKFP